MIKIFQTPTALDFRILEAINGFHNPFFDQIMVFASNIGEYAIIWLVIGLCFSIFDKKHGRHMFAILIMALIIEVIINDGLLKNIFYRERPFLLFPALHHLGPDAINSAFVSGHTASSTAIFLVLIKFYKKATSPLLALVILMIWTRFYLGMHYPSDIIGGIATGIVSSWLAFLIGKKVLRYNHN